MTLNSLKKAITGAPRHSKTYMVRRLETLKKLPIKNKKDYKRKSKEFKLRLQLNRKGYRMRFSQMKSIIIY